MYMITLLFALPTIEKSRRFVFTASMPFSPISKTIFEQQTGIPINPFSLKNAITKRTTNARIDENQLTPVGSNDHNTVVRKNPVSNTDFIGAERYDKAAVVAVYQRCVTPFQLRVMFNTNFLLRGPHVAGCCSVFPALMLNYCARSVSAPFLSTAFAFNSVYATLTIRKGTFLFELKMRAPTTTMAANLSVPAFNNITSSGTFFCERRARERASRHVGMPPHNRTSLSPHTL